MRNEMNEVRPLRCGECGARMILVRTEARYLDHLGRPDPAEVVLDEHVECEGGHKFSVQWRPTPRGGETMILAPM